ncbi:LysR substrate-binding domain-containing protein [Rhizobium sp. BK376]|uniref:LysR substrate-binding domain-containing protein n=1 Tax=Rhizobium sp. BK376 TaxID=2512149 RepID=UPI00104DCB06|nr:LysR substrate-binding domain-containing protein [Rhizobium sp. BK376]TCR91705.1 LysR family transcriptional regulator [Rhizobium sp. BK376]
MPRPLPPIAALKAFCAITDTGGFGRAAERVGLTQTAVSHQIAQLEEWIGGALLVRGRRGATLTPLGASLHPAVSQAIDQLERALHQARSNISSQTLTLSVTPEFSSGWLGQRLKDFCQRYPEVVLNLTVTYRRPDFDQQDIDLAISLGPETPGLVGEPLFAEEEFVVCAPKYLGRLPPRGAIASAPLLRFAGMRHALLDWQRWYEQVTTGENEELASFHIAKAVADGPDFDSLEEMLQACRQGAGFALVRTSLVADDLQKGSLVRCFTEIQPASLNYTLIYPANALKRPVIALFRNWLIAQRTIAAS